MNLFKILFCLAIITSGAYAGFFPINKGMVNQATTVTTAAGTTTAVATSNQVYIFEGSSNQSFQTPAATALPRYWWYEIVNNSTGSISFKDGAGATVSAVSAGRTGKFILTDNSLTAGTWKLSLPAAPGDIISSHSALSNLSADDHTQYHNNTRGDARYFRQDQHITASAGSGSSGSPIVLNSSGQVDDSMLPASSSNAWSKIGNSGLTAGTNFLGTTDAVDLVLKTNNTERFRITSDGIIDTALSTGVLHSGATGLVDSRGVINADIDATANIAYSKLNLGTSIVNADVSGSAAIAYSKLNLGTSIVNADISASAGIVDTKLATISTALKVSNSATTATSLNVNDAIAARSATGNITAASFNGAIATGNITGIFGVPNGGSGLSSATANSMMVTGTESQAPFTTIPSGTSGQVLTSRGSALPPSFQSASAGAIYLGQLNHAGAANCFWGVTANTTFTAFGVDADCATPTVTLGNSSALAAPSTKLPAVKILSAYVDTTSIYKVTITGTLAQNSVAGECTWRISEGTNASKPAMFYAGTGVKAYLTTMVFYIQMSTTGDRTVEIQATGYRSSMACEIQASSAGFQDLTFDVERITTVP